MPPHRPQPTSLPCPWDSPGKNTGVGHFLLQCMKVKSESEVAQPCPTLSNPVDCSLPASSIHGILQARVLEWVASAFPTWCMWFSILEGAQVLIGLKEATISMTWAFLHSSPSHLQSMSQESHSVPPQIVPCSFYDPGWVTPFPLYSGDFSIGLCCRIRLWVRFYSKVCASQFVFFKLLLFSLLKNKSSLIQYSTKQVYYEW